MDIQVRLFSFCLTPEQEEQQEKTYEAAKLLKEHGYKVKVTKYIVTKPTDRPAGLHIL